MERYLKQPKTEKAQPLSDGMILMVIGDRTLRNKTLVYKALDNFTAVHGPPTLVIHGGNRGADELADAWAKEHKYEVAVYKPNIKAFGTFAGARRNDEMLSRATHLVAFPSRKGRLSDKDVEEDERMKLLRAPPLIVWV